MNIHKIREFIKTDDFATALELVLSVGLLVFAIIGLIIIPALRDVHNY